QAFSHGRTKTVVVEKVKSRTPGKPKAEASPAAEKGLAKRPLPGKAGTAAPSVAPAVGANQTAAVAPKPSGMVLRELTPAEQSARAHALSDARLRDLEERKIQEEMARVRE